MKQKRILSFALIIAMIMTMGVFTPFTASAAWSWPDGEYVPQTEDKGLIKVTPDGGTTVNGVLYLDLTNPVIPVKLTLDFTAGQVTTAIPNEIMVTPVGASVGIEALGSGESTGDGTSVSGATDVVGKLDTDSLTLEVTPSAAGKTIIYIKATDATNSEVIEGFIPIIVKEVGPAPKFTKSELDPAKDIIPGIATALGTAKLGKALSPGSTATVPNVFAYEMTTTEVGATGSELTIRDRGIGLTPLVAAANTPINGLVTGKWLTIYELTSSTDPTKDGFVVKYISFEIKEYMLRNERKNPTLAPKSPLTGTVGLSAADPLPIDLSVSSGLVDKVYTINYGATGEGEYKYDKTTGVTVELVKTPTNEALTTAKYKINKVNKEFTLYGSYLKTLTPQDDPYEIKITFKENGGTTPVPTAAADPVSIFIQVTKSVADPLPKFSARDISLKPGAIADGAGAAVLAKALPTTTNKYYYEMTAAEVGPAATPLTDGATFLGTNELTIDTTPDSSPTMVSGGIGSKLAGLEVSVVATPKWLTIYEVANTGKIVKYYSFEITADMVRIDPVNPAITGATGDSLVSGKTGMTEALAVEVDLKTPKAIEIAITDLGKCGYADYAYDGATVTITEIGTGTALETLTSYKLDKTTPKLTINLASVKALTANKLYELGIKFSPNSKAGTNGVDAEPIPFYINVTDSSESTIGAFTVKGTVKTGTTPIQNAKVVLLDKDSNIVGVPVYTDTKGIYTFTNVPSTDKDDAMDMYTIKASAILCPAVSAATTLYSGMTVSGTATLVKTVYTAADIALTAGAKGSSAGQINPLFAVSDSGNDYYIDLETETINLNEFPVKSYSVDGGNKWKVLKDGKALDAKLIGSLLSKGMTLAVSDKEYDKKTKKMQDGADVIKFESIGARPKLPKYIINYAAKAETSPNSGTWEAIPGNQWALAVKGSDKEIFEYKTGIALQLAPPAVDNIKVPGTFANLATGGQAVPVFGDAKAVYFIRIPATADTDGTLTAASVAKKFTIASQRKPPSYKVKDGVISYRKNTLVASGGGTPELMGEAGTIEGAGTYTFQFPATAKKPASAIQELTIE